MQSEKDQQEWYTKALAAIKNETNPIVKAHLMRDLSYNLLSESEKL